MKHRMLVHNASSGVAYEMLLERGPGAWTATWRTLGGDGALAPGPAGTLVDTDAFEAFRAVKRALEDADEGVIDQDWVFEEPLPPWLVD